MTNKHVKVKCFKLYADETIHKKIIIIDKSIFYKRN
jgi:hypothetical protein